LERPTIQKTNSIILLAMATFLIAYKLNGPERVNDRLIDEIKRTGRCCQSMESIWIVRSSDTCELIRERLAKHLNSVDELLVLGLRGHWATSNIGNECREWLTQNL